MFIGGEFNKSADSPTGCENILYISTREDHTVSADHYMRGATEWVIRKSRTSMEPGFMVLD
jgi:hypothetical protein